MTDIKDRGTLIVGLRNADRLATIVAELREPIQAHCDGLLLPFVLAEAKIEGVRAELLEEHDAEIAGKCEGCSAYIFEGDLHQRTEDLEYLCADCAATWGDVAKQLRERIADPQESADKAELADSLQNAEIMIGQGYGDKPAVFT